MTFPGGTHDLWLRYWVKASGAEVQRRGDPAGPTGPDGPEHGRRQRSRATAWASRGAPWPSRQGDRLHPPRHPGPLAEPPREGVPRPPTSSRPSAPTWCRTHGPGDPRRSAEVARRLQANRDQPPPRSSAPEHYINAPAAEIARPPQRHLPTWASTSGRRTTTASQMRFFRDGATNLRPQAPTYIWAMAQYQQLGLLAEASRTRRPWPTSSSSPTCTHEVCRRRGHRGARRRHEARSRSVLDGAAFDPNDPAAEVARA